MNPAPAIRSVAILATGLLVVAAWSLVGAQTTQTIPLFTLDISPLPVFAGDQAVITVLPQNFNTASTTFQWKYNGAAVPSASGIGKSQYAIGTAAQGPEIITISVLVDPGPGFQPRELSQIVVTVQRPEDPTDLLGALQSDFSLELSPESPNPGQEVRVSVTSLAFDRERASFQWSVNGAAQAGAGGRGRWFLTLPPGREGESRTVRVTVTTPAGLTRTQSITVQSISMPLYWWTNTEVPYWYKGKALPTAASELSVAAFPNVANARDLAYRWELNDTIAPAASGIGRAAFSLPLTLPIAEKITVTAQNASGSFRKTGSIAFAPLPPLVRVYPNDAPGLPPGEAIATYEASAGSPYAFVAVPFFFSRAAGGTVQYAWTLNGRRITGEFDEPWLFTLLSGPREPSTNRLSVEIRDPRRSGAASSRDLTINLR
ncbi:hypothetical protein C4552_01755 [Candidatus Parcubacteria bacterium]|nr:MAG: hypothetical protein C4552_01755 [Candidatus Parcubacteria bacterium]